MDSAGPISLPDGAGEEEGACRRRGPAGGGGGLRAHALTSRSVVPAGEVSTPVSSPPTTKQGEEGFFL